MQAVIDYLKEHQSRFVDQLCEYVRFPSVSAQPQHRQDLQACAQWVVSHCQGIGLEARLCATQGNPVVVAKTPHQPPADRKSEVGSRTRPPPSDLRPPPSALHPSPALPRLWPLRRAAAGTVRTLEIAAVRAENRGWRTFRTGSKRQK